MVKLILPNSAPPGQESQKCLENSATDLVTSRKKLELSSPRGRTSSPRAGARWPKLCTYFRDIFGSPGQGGPSWAKWVSPLNSSMKTTTFKPNLYVYHWIPLIIKSFSFIQFGVFLTLCVSRPFCKSRSVSSCTSCSSLLTRWMCGRFSHDDSPSCWNRIRACWNGCSSSLSLVSGGLDTKSAKR